jgi:ParB-like chromosome segregation protein Spo0J
MMKVEIKEVKISEIKLNPNNPRRISKQDMDRLVKSLAEFPDMLNIREIVVDETMTILGGNMRYLALKKSGAKAATAKIVSGLTKEQKREFVIKDNSNFGEYDFDALANGWGDLPLVDWGVDLPEDWEKLLDGTGLPSPGSGEEKKNETTCPKCGFSYAI